MPLRSYESDTSGDVTKQDRALRQLSVLKFLSVLAPIILIYGLVGYIQALSSTSHYHRDCSFALSSPGQSSPTQPCIYEAATASLKTITAGNHKDHQEAEISFPNGSAASMDIAALDGKIDFFSELSGTQINGPCQVEMWHGKITAIIRANHRIASEDNPEEEGSNLFGFLSLALLVLTVVVWFYTSWLSRAARAR